MVLITGATGFVGSALGRRLVHDGLHEVVGAVRASGVRLSGGVRAVAVGDISADTDWTRALEHVDLVVHAAARVHVSRDVATDPVAEYRRTNVQGTLNLGLQAARAGVRRLVFVSTIKVNGEQTSGQHAYAADEGPSPQDPYAWSKKEAEDELRKIARETGMEVVIVRPPLVYGPGVKANFLSLIRWVHRGVPLPLGAVHNLRSFVALDNLVDLLVLCLEHPRAADQTFLVSDGQDLSTTELLTRLGQALGKPARLLPVPERLLMLAGTMLGKEGAVQRLCGSLRVDIRKTRQLLDWSPPVTVDEGLRKTAERFLSEVHA